MEETTNTWVGGGREGGKKVPPLSNVYILPRYSTLDASNIRLNLLHYLDLWPGFLLSLIVKHDEADSRQNSQHLDRKQSVDKYLITVKFMNFVIVNYNRTFKKKKRSFFCFRVVVDSSEQKQTN